MQRLRGGRLVIFHFGGSESRLLGLASDGNAQGADPLIIDLSWSGALRRAHPYLKVRHVSEYHLAPRVRNARYLAAAWLQRIPFDQIDLSGEPFLDTFHDVSGALWWQIDISLQEKLYLSVRLIEVVREIVRTHHATHFAVVGDHDYHVWKRGVIKRTCRQDGLQLYRPIRHVPDEIRGVGAPSVTTLTPAELPPAREILDKKGRPKRRRGKPITVRAVGEPFVRFTSAAVVKVAAVLSLAPVLATAVLLPVVLAAGFILFLPIWFVRWVFSRGRISGLRRSYRSGYQRAFGGARSNLGLLTIGLIAFAILVDALLRPETQTLLGALVVPAAILLVIAYAVAILVAPTSYSVVDLVLWPARAIRRTLLPFLNVRHLRALAGFALRGALRLGRSPAATLGRPKAAKKRVAFLIDEGNLKPRYHISRNRRFEYIPYLEGVIEAFRRRQDVEVLIITHGRPFAISGPIGRLAHWWRRVGAPGWVKMSSFITPQMHARANPIRVRRMHEWTALAADVRFRRAFTYDGVRLWSLLRPDVKHQFVGTYGTRIYQEAFGAAFKKLKPELLVTYNFEGVFRRWLQVPIDRGIPVLGMQQALGPYVHGLDHLLAGYSQPRKPLRRGVPTPDKIAVWGESHRKLLQEYGYPPGSLVVTGYPRTDTYVNERGTLSRRAILRKLGIRNDHARLIAFTAVLRVLHTGLMREDHWLQTFRDLADLAVEDQNVYIIVKPWGGDNLKLIRQAIDLYGHGGIRYIDPNIDVHNAELLSVVDVLAGTFSSIFSEAAIMDVVSIMLDYPETRYYFGPDYVTQYEDVALRATSPAEASALIREALYSDEKARERYRASALAALRPIFGPLDGRSADRVAEAGMSLIPGSAAQESVPGGRHVRGASASARSR